MTDPDHPHPTDALVEKLPVPEQIRWATQKVVRDWWDENVAPLVESAPVGDMRYRIVLGQRDGWKKRAEKAEAKLAKVRTLLDELIQLSGWSEFDSMKPWPTVAKLREALGMGDDK